MTTSPASIARAERPASLATWLQTARVKSLAISSISVFTGAAMAWYDGYASPWVLVAWLGACAAQAGTNLTNVSYNYKAGVTRVGGFTPDPQGSSAPVRTGLLDAEQVRAAANLCFALAVATGVGLVAVRGPAILLLGIPGLVVGWGYAAPPLRLSWRGLGVLSVLAFMGPVMVGGTYFVAAGHFGLHGFIASIPVGLTAAAIMHVNDLRDFDADVAHGKLTLAIRLGRDTAVSLLAAMTLGAVATVGLATLRGVFPWPVLATALALPAMVAQWRFVQRERDSAPLNLAWFMGVKLHSQFGLLLIAGLVVGRLLHL